MPAASLDELRFFLDDRDDIARQIHATGATTTQVMTAIGAHEEGVILLGAPAAVHAVYEILENVDGSLMIDGEICD